MLCLPFLGTPERDISSSLDANRNVEQDAVNATEGTEQEQECTEKPGNYDHPKGCNWAALILGWSHFAGPTCTVGQYMYMYIHQVFLRYTHQRTWFRALRSKEHYNAFLRLFSTMAVFSFNCQGTICSCSFQEKMHIWPTKGVCNSYFTVPRFSQVRIVRNRIFKGTAK